MKKIRKITNAIISGTLFKKIRQRHNAKKFYKKAKLFYDDDERYLTEQYKFHIGKKPNLDFPKTYNEKLLWLKLYWRDSRVYSLVDKYEVRKYIENIGLKEILIPLFGVYDNLDSINLELLPKEFIIKTTHDSGGTFKVTNKNSVWQINRAFKKINRALNRGVYNKSKEWVYEKVKPRVIIEQLLKDKDNKSINDYKIFCYNGKAKFIMVATDRDQNIKLDFFDTHWNWFDFKNGANNNKNKPYKPKNLSKMISIAEQISDDYPHVRVDLYNIEGKIFFGEMTFFSGSGLDPFEPEKYDYLFGKYLELPKKNV